MAERGERRLQGHGQHAGRPPVQGGRSAGTHVELGGVGSAQDAPPDGGENSAHSATGIFQPRMGFDQMSGISKF